MQISHFQNGHGIHQYSDLNCHRNIHTELSVTMLQSLTIRDVGHTVMAHDNNRPLTFVGLVPTGEVSMAHHYFYTTISFLYLPSHPIIKGIK